MGAIRGLYRLYNLITTILFIISLLSDIIHFIIRLF